ncbi:hypothetical protein GGD62_003422 [Bradyrhizobium sp. ERR14]|nr:hypothetical protein [Bradyrhizobium sp. ERR14]
MMAVPAMHEDMHKRTSEERQPDQEPEHMGPVLGEQKRAGDDQKSCQDEAGLGFGGHALGMPLSIRGMILHRHGRAPLDHRSIGARLPSLLTQINGSGG